MGTSIDSQAAPIRIISLHAKLTFPLFFVFQGMGFMLPVFPVERVLSHSSRYCIGDDSPNEPVEKYFCEIHKKYDLPRCSLLNALMVGNGFGILEIINFSHFGLFLQAQRLSSAAPGEERSDETGVGCSDLFGVISIG